MSATEHELELELETEAPETGLLRRVFAAEVTPGEGRTIDVRIVPYGERITHSDGLGGSARGVSYTEEWSPGAFAEQIRNGFGEAGRAKKISMNYDHQRGLQNEIGHGLALRETSDGLYGSFVFYEDPAGDKALTLVREGMIDGISLEAKAKRGQRTAEGVIKRTAAHLHAVALTRFPAYSGARVLALREEADTIIDEEYLPVAPDPELIARCERLGIKIPQRYKAPPEDTDTSAESDTSADGTRQSPEYDSKE